MIGLYQHRHSAIHRMWPGLKLALLLVFGTVLFFVHQPLLLVLVLSVIVVLFPIAQLSLRLMWLQLKPALFMLLIVFVVQWIFSDYSQALIAVLRLAALGLLATLVTLSTRTSDLIDVLISTLRPLEFFSLRTDKIALLLSLTVTYIPLLFNHYHQLRDAQRARCIKPTVFSLVLPLVIQVLRLADNLAEAIDARAFNTD